MNKGDIIIHIHDSVWTYKFIRYISKSRNARSEGDVYSILLDAANQFSKVAVPFYPVTSNV